MQIDPTTLQLVKQDHEIIRLRDNRKTAALMLKALRAARRILRMVGVVTVGMLLLLPCTAHAQNTGNPGRITTMFRPNCLPLIHHTCSELADAIYLAEGGSKTKHPYGILTHYKYTDARTACLNTIHHQIRLWLATDQRKRFLDYLAGVYAPVGAANDPLGLNSNWKHNIAYYLEKGITK